MVNNDEHKNVVDGKQFDGFHGCGHRHWYHEDGGDFKHLEDYEDGQDKTKREGGQLGLSIPSIKSTGT